VARRSVANLNPPGFLGAFFFSIETSATVGFGDMHPQTIFGHTLASIEIFVSIISVALTHGSDVRALLQAARADPVHALPRRSSAGAGRLIDLGQVAVSAARTASIRSRVSTAT